MVCRSIENTIEEAHTSISSPPEPASMAEFLDTAPPVPDMPSYYKPLSTEAAWLLQKRCPACFGGHMKG